MLLTEVTWCRIISADGIAVYDITLTDIKDDFNDAG